MEFNKIKVDREKCIGCGACSIMAPQTFKMDDEGKSVVIDPPGDDVSAIKMAKESCPVEAISIEE